MKKKNFVVCGLAGWCIEVAFTSAGAILKKDKKIMGQSSAWMFPIYGLAACIDDIYPKIKNWSPFNRSLLYGSMIITTEYITGSILTKIDACPWDYSDSKYNFKGIIRADYFPLWMATGLLYERILLEVNKTKKVSE